MRDEHLFRVLVEHVGDAVFMLGADGRIATWSPSAERIFGYSAADVLGRDVSSLNAEDTCERTAQELAAARASTRHEVESTRRRHDGSTFPARVVVCPIIEDGGELAGYGVIVQDRTLLRAVEETRALYTAALERSNRELQEFASIASHDLQEPLRKIVSFADRLQTRSRTTLDESSLDYLTRIQAAAQRMKRLVADLLAYSRLGAAPATMRRVDLESLVAGVVEELDERIRADAGVVEVSALPTIDADPSQLRQLFQNLLINALKFHRENTGAKVTVTSRPSTLRGRPAVDILVADDGIGFDAKYVDRIFTMLQRLHSREAYEGTGMGLAICRRIAERHGGTITAQSAPGQGATFVVTLPVRHLSKETHS